MSDSFIVTSRFGNAPKQSSSACIVPQIATDLNLLQVHLKNQYFNFNKTSIYIIHYTVLQPSEVSFVLFFKDFIGFYLLQTQFIKGMPWFYLRHFITVTYLLNNSYVHWVSFLPSDISVNDEKYFHSSSIWLSTTMTMTLICSVLYLFIV